MEQRRETLDRDDRMAGLRRGERPLRVRCGEIAVAREAEAAAR
jgi:hypothetical protein